MDHKLNCYSLAVCEEASGLFSIFLTGCSLLLIAATLPLSLFFVVKVVQVLLELKCTRSC